MPRDHLAYRATIEHRLRAVSGQTVGARLVATPLTVDAVAEQETLATEAGEADVAAAKWAWENNRNAGRGSDTLPGAKRLFLPMRTGRGPVRVLMHIHTDRPRAELQHVYLGAARTLRDDIAG